MSEWLSWDWPQGLWEKTALFAGHPSPCQILSYSGETGNSSFRFPPCSAQFLGMVETCSGRIFQGRAFLSLQSREIQGLGLRIVYGHLSLEHQTPRIWVPLSFLSP